MIQGDQPDTYRERRERFSAIRDGLDRKTRRLVNLRMVCFLSACLSLIGALDMQAYTVQLFLVVLGISLLVAFVFLVAIDSKTRKRRRLFEELVAVNRDALKRRGREWDDLDEPDYGPPPDHAYAADLDLFGHASLFQLLGTAITIPGREKLRDWLLQPADLPTVRMRQTAVAELAPLLDYRDHVEAHARMIGREHPNALRAFLE